VLQGPQGGARSPLDIGMACVLATAPDGAGEGADIVLRDDAAARIRVTAALTHALLEVLHGEVHLDEQVLAAGARCSWAACTALRIGQSVIAFGPADVDAWTLAEAPVAAALPSAEPAADAAPEPPPPLRRRAEVWLATTGAMVLLACVGAMFMAHVAAAPQSAQANSASSLAAALRASEFAALDARERADGQLTLRGHLATQAQRTRLDAWLAAHPFAPTLDVQVDELIARDVTEVFRVNGVSVQANVIGPGRIAAEAAERDADRLARAEDVVRRDVRHLDALTVRNTVTPLPPPAPPVVDDPNKRIASVVPGEPAYVVTVDGARYFVGALLPSGHRLTQVAAQRITLERDGQQSTLNF
ncbi:MAG TPA: hypothetical protein VJ608_05750, partial [Albitalea sp.]|nr:hypothetical protein [Albitalea sp.]